MSESMADYFNRTKGQKSRSLERLGHPVQTKYPDHDPALAVVAVDFDGVLAENVWPSPHIGALNYDAVDLVCHYARLGCEVVIFTSRPASHFTRIWAWVKDNGLSSLIYDVTNVKPRASLYFDDRAVRWPL